MLFQCIYTFNSLQQRIMCLFQEFWSHHFELFPFPEISLKANVLRSTKEPPIYYSNIFISFFSLAYLTPLSLAYISVSLSAILKWSPTLRLTATSQTKFDVWRSPKIGQMRVIPNTKNKYLKNKLGPLTSECIFILAKDPFWLKYIRMLGHQNQKEEENGILNLLARFSITAWIMQLCAPPMPPSAECRVSSVHRVSVECPLSVVECPSSDVESPSSVHRVSIECPSSAPRVSIECPSSVHRVTSTYTQRTLNVTRRSLDRHSTSLDGHSKDTLRSLDTRHSMGLVV